MNNNGIERIFRGRGRRGRQNGYSQNQSGDSTLPHKKETKGFYNDANEQQLGNQKSSNNQSRPGDVQLVKKYEADDSTYVDATEENSGNRKWKNGASKSIENNAECHVDINQTSNRRNLNYSNNSRNKKPFPVLENKNSGMTNNQSDLYDLGNVPHKNERTQERNRNERGEPCNHNYVEEQATECFENNVRTEENWRNHDTSHGYEKSDRNDSQSRQRQGQNFMGNNVRKGKNNSFRHNREYTYDSNIAGDGYMVKDKNADYIPGGRQADFSLNDATNFGSKSYRNRQGREERYRGDDRKWNNRGNFTKHQNVDIIKNMQKQSFPSNSNNKVQNHNLEKDNNEVDIANDGKSVASQFGYNVNAEEFVPGRPAQIKEKSQMDVGHSFAKIKNTWQDCSVEQSDPFPHVQQEKPHSNVEKIEASNDPLNKSVTPDYSNEEKKDSNQFFYNSWENENKPNIEASNDPLNKTVTPDYSNEENEVSNQLCYDAWENKNKPPSQLATTNTCRVSGSMERTDKRMEMLSCKGDTDSWITRSKHSNKNTRVSLPDPVRQQTDAGKGRKSMGDSPINQSSWDKEFIDYDRNYRSKRMKDEDYKIVKEIQQDLFLMGVEYALANCVAEDLGMGSGIAVSFRQNFKRTDELSNQNVKQGGLAVLHIDDGRYIYYLITKQKSSGKPTLETMFRSVKKLRDHMVEHDVGKLAIPRLGCGLDRLEWRDVKNMLEFLFKDTNIEIVVCNFQQAAEVMQQKNEEHHRRKCKLEHFKKPIIEAEKFTIIIYFGFEDGYVSPQIECLEKKFNILREYKANKKSLGTQIEQNRMNFDYLLFGCIVQKDKNDQIHFDHLANCLREINKKNQKWHKNSEGYDYVALQTYSYDKETVLMDKIINLARNILYGITLCIYPE